MMKILYSLFSFTVGGAERLVTDICNQMIKSGNEVHLYIINDHYSDKMISTLDKNVTISLQKRKKSFLSKFSTLFKISKYIKKNKIDVIHANSFNIPETLLLKRFCYNKVKIVHTIHDVTQYRTLSKAKVKYRNSVCDRFVAISDSVKNDIISNGAMASKVSVVYNAIDLNKFYRKNNRIFDADNVVIGNVARFIPEKKGQDILIKAVAIVKKKYPRIKCLFAGSYDNLNTVQLADINHLIRINNLDENIVLCGNVDDIPSFLEQLDIFVLPSRYEGFGISLIEAMSMEIPCIASNLDGPKEIIRQDEFGLLFEKDNYNQLAEKIFEVLDNYDIYRNKANKSADYVRNIFDIKKMCNELMKLYS